MCGWERQLNDEERRLTDLRAETTGNRIGGIPSRMRRRKSETLRAQICAGTWNVGGRIPPDDLDLSDWLDMSEAADIYVLGFQEVVPLNAGNIFGAEDSRPIRMWEYLIRETLNKIRPVKEKYKDDIISIYWSKLKHGNSEMRESLSDRRIAPHVLAEKIWYDAEQWMAHC
ncbi:Type IV [Carex littledalei]|uniref:Type IV n=1 Tax=Carex littledalei TaxID=544730 RepID=A0A833RDI8_9POAL|nr:Type IV [Carex littledalei]